REEARAAADDVVLALVAEDDVAAASALDVVAPVDAGAHVVRLRPEVVGGRVDRQVVARVAASVNELREAPAGTADGPGRREAAERRGGRQVCERCGQLPVTLDDVVPELAEDHVVAGSARDVIVAEAVVVRGLSRKGLVDRPDDLTTDGLGEELV